MGALNELAWNVLVFGGPILLAWLWTKRQKTRRTYTTEEWEAFGAAIRESVVTGYNNAIRVAQQRKDDQIFNTVKEYRDELG